MGLNVLLLADSTSRWAQALREMSGRLEEIPGEEAFPAYLESVIAGFLRARRRRAPARRLDGSVTIGGTVSPAGGNFEEPVTQATLKVVGAFHGLSANALRRPPLPGHRPARQLEQVRGVVDGPTSVESSPARCCARQRGRPDDEGRRRGGHLDRTTSSPTSRPSISTPSTCSRTPSTRSTRHPGRAPARVFGVWHGMLRAP
jgi:hypothetical protein